MEINYIQKGINIPNEDIIDVLITALEGGSNYWYYILETSNRSSVKIVLDVLTTEEEITVYDVETDDELGVLSRDNIKQGIKMFIENGYEFEPDMDADDADTFFQYVVMGEIVFG